MKKNKSVKWINLFNNKIGFDGAKGFADLIEVNNTIEFLDLGHNRIRNKGITVLGESLAKNPSNNLKVLGLRFNFLSDEGVIEFLKKVYLKAKNNKLTDIFLKNNSITEFGLQ